MGAAGAVDAFCGGNRQMTINVSRVYATALVTLAELAHLTWEHFHGGVLSHHFLDSADMPAISNLWGALLIPAMTWFLTGRIVKRIPFYSGGESSPSRRPWTVMAGFVCSLLFGILLAVAFTNHDEAIASNLFMGIFFLALLLPVFRSECVLGFVLGMTFTFGAILPTFIASMLAALSATIYFYVRPVLSRIWNWLKRA